MRTPKASGSLASPVTSCTFKGCVQAQPHNHIFVVSYSCTPHSRHFHSSCYSSSVQLFLTISHFRPTTVSPIIRHAGLRERQVMKSVSQMSCFLCKIVDSAAHVSIQPESVFGKSTRMWGVPLMWLRPSSQHIASLPHTLLHGLLASLIRSSQASLPQIPKAYLTRLQAQCPSPRYSVRLMYAIMQRNETLDVKGESW